MQDNIRVKTEEIKVYNPDEIMDFIIGLSREMLRCGANLERISISLNRLAKVYDLNDVSMSLVNSTLMISAKGMNEVSLFRQTSVGNCGIDLAGLRKLNELVHHVRAEKTSSDKLATMLDNALKKSDYPKFLTILAYNLAMLCLCRIFGGVWQDMIVVIINTTVLYFITMFLSGENLNRIISNVVSMFFCGCSAIIFSKIGFARHLSSIIITNAFYLIPGIQMVNAFRNILCGNEMNGIIEMVKVLLEVVTIVAGLYIACLVFGTGAVAFI